MQETIRGNALATGVCERINAASDAARKVLLSALLFEGDGDTLLILAGILKASTGEAGEGG